ncbi:GatB/YqeY domain-containing protein [Candidatus Uhrbacteria bacterium]|nr:GatB/YqeY domain-containing protein [Candidatus Uhrbacteria bacterium]
MTILERIDADFKTAYKAQQAERVSTLRLLKSALKNRQIELMHPLTDEETLAIVKGQLKQLQEALEIARGAGRAELVTKAEGEILLLEAYLPAQLPEDELRAIVQESLAASGASSKADFGKAMGIAMKAVAGRADGGRVRDLVQSLLPLFVLVSVGALAFADQTFAASAVSAGKESGLMLLRSARVLVLMMGIVCANLVLLGSFNWMVASGADETYTKAKKQVFMGILGSVLVMAVFVVVSARIMEMM